MSTYVDEVFAAMNFERRLKHLHEAKMAVKKHRAECRAKGVEPAESYSEAIHLVTGVRL